MIGAIAGDIIGSRFEFNNTKSKDFDLFTEKSRFTDDSVLTIATADGLLNRISYIETYKNWPRKYPNQGYGHSFTKWMKGNNPFPYGSYGNGSAMRVSPVGWVFDTKEQVLEEAKRSAMVTHSHPEGIKGAQAVALSVFLARKQSDRKEIASVVGKMFDYKLDQSLDEIRPGYTFDVSCQGSVPQAIIAFLESTSFEDAIRNAISIGGDSDTIACISGAIAHAYYGEVPKEILQGMTKILPEDIIALIDDFTDHFQINY